MTVAELIEVLAQLPPDMPVKVEGEGYGERVDVADVDMYDANAYSRDPYVLISAVS